jgi:prevent-host-death family protein
LDQIFNIHEAKTNLSALIAKAEAGEDVVIARSGKPAVKLVPVRGKGRSDARRKVAGSLKAKIWVGSDFDAPLPEEVLAAFRGEKP